MISYRRDIDGLRALAVLSVVLFHIDSALVPGGFIGVDIFFVISGFLITGIISKSSAAGTFSFLEFYRRRIKRIIPVLTVVILTTLIVGHFILLPEDLEKLSISAVASQFFVANIYFTYFLDTSYFADDAALQPLLHLWSLGVEEQFYLFWPLLLTTVLGKIKKIPFLLTILVAASILSFLWGEALLNSNAMYAYYMLPSRAGELLVGAVCYFCTRSERLSNLSRARHEVLAWVGLGLVVYSLVALSEDKGFPGINAIPVTLGTALLIFTGSRATPVLSRVLSLRPLVMVGVISYSMYLWHWPLLAYMKYIYVELTVVQKFVSFILIFVLSVASYLLVEKPFKADTRGFVAVFVRQLLIPTAAIVLICGLIIGSAGYGLYYFNDGYKKALIAQNDLIKPAFKFPFVCQRSLLRNDDLVNPNCIIGGKEEPRILLWGDSNAAYYVGVIGELGRKYGFTFRNVIHSACPPMLNDPQRFVYSNWKQPCQRSAIEVAGIVGNYDTVLLGGGWSSYIRLGKGLFVNEMKKTVSELVRQGKHVVLLGRVPYVDTFDRKCQPKTLKIPSLDCTSMVQVNRASVQKINSVIKQIAASSGAQYFDVNDVLCKENLCSAILDDQLVYFDSGHLSLNGSILVGKHLIEDKWAGRVFAELAGPGARRGTVVLPWDKNVNSWATDIKVSNKHVVVNSEEFLNPENWSGKKPVASPGESSLVFTDDSKMSYQASAFSFSNKLDRIVQNSDDSLFLVIELQVQKNQLEYPLFRLRVDQKQPKDFDFIIDGDAVDTYLRGDNSGAYAVLNRVDKLLNLKMAIPVRLLHGDLKLFILPAASERKLKYSQKNVGTVVLDKAEAFLSSRS